jgi:hypothetical protein
MKVLELRPVAWFTALLIVGSLVLVTESAQAEPQGKRSPTAQTAVVRDCTWATKHARFAAVRVKKVRKRVVNGQLPAWKLKSALRIYKQAVRFKNDVCGSGPPPPSPLALTESEVTSRVDQQAAAYCAVDSFCYSSGHYTDGGSLACSSRSTYSWSCYGYNDEYDGTFYTCDFREIVERSGYNGIASRQDLTYGSSGWACS